MLYISYGSVFELETQILLSGDFGYIEKKDFEILIQKLGEIERMLKALISSLGKHSNP